MQGSSLNSCPKCRAHVKTEWKYCPSCSVELAHEAQQAAHMHHQPEKVPVKSSFSGLFFGLIAAPILVIAGGMICLTGLGIFLGVPLIIAGVCAPLIGPLVGLNSLKGSCPWCQGEISGVGLFDFFSCPNCNHRIAVKDHEMLKAE